MSAKLETLRFERVRNFGAAFRDTRNFIRENFGVFFKTILFLVGPLALVTCTLNIYYQVNLASQTTEAFRFNMLGSYLAYTVIFSQLRWAINGLFTAMVVSHFLKVHREKGSGKYDVGDVTRSLLRDFGGNALAFLVLLIAVTLIALVVGFFIYAFAQFSVGTAVLIFMAGIVAYFMVRFPMWYFVFSIFIARTSAKENTNVFAGMARAGRFFAGNWWTTWVIFFCLWALLYAVGVTLSLPATLIVVIAKMTSFRLPSEESPEWKLAQTILLSLGEFAKTIVNSVFCVTVALHYYSLKEKTDGEGTMQLVEMIGTKQQDEEAELTY